MALPDLYNIALDCIDKNAQSLLNKHKTALLCAESTGDQTFERKRLTFSNLEGLTNRIANALKNISLPKGARIILRLPNCPEFPVTFLGAVKAGLIPIPTSPLLTWSELRFMMEDSEAAVLVTTTGLLPEFPDSERPSSLKEILLVSPLGQTPPPGSRRWEDLLKSSEPVFQTEPTQASDPAFWLYTSGTEGRPKAVIHAHRSIPAHDSRMRLWQDAKSGNVIFNTSALNWSYALTAGLLDVWRHGLTAVVYEGPSSPEALGPVIRDLSVTTFMSVPGIYRRLAEHPEAKNFFSKVRVCLSAGEKLSEEVHGHFLQNTGLEIREGLGMTEHSVYLIQGVGSPLVPGSCGKGLPEEKTAILRPDLSVASPGEIGILASRRDSPGVMLGYHRRPDEEAKAFQGEWFLSGDLASQDAEGNFFFVGRSDDVITAGGYRISPMEVEAALNQHPLVLESAAVGWDKEPGKTLIAAFVVLKNKSEDLDAARAGLLSFAAGRLARYKAPREIFFVETLPKTRNGKIQRAEVKNYLPK